MFAARHASCVTSGYIVSPTPHRRPLELQLELTKTELNGRPMALKMTPVTGLAVDPSGRRGQWTTKPPSGKVELEATAELPPGDAKPRCGSKLPVVIEGTWKAHYRGSWKIDGAAHGRLSAAHPVEAFVDCGPSMPIVVSKDDEPLAD